MLTGEQIDRFRTDGYLVLPGVLQPSEIRASLKLINHSIGHVGINASSMKQKAGHIFCRELTRDPVLIALANNGGIGALVQRLVGPQLLPVNDVQIALRFPISEDSRSPMIPHIDGTYDSENGMRPEQLFSFTTLAVAFLADVSELNSGNFTVYPGSHHLLQQYFRIHGSHRIFTGVPTGLDLGSPLQLTARQGDVVLAHYMLAHTVAPHRTHNIRYAAIYRFKHASHDRNKPNQASNIWCEYEGIGEATV
jgi:hypothetical protein